jgi:hypothetical protein
VKDPELDAEKCWVCHIPNEELNRACPVGGREQRQGLRTTGVGTIPQTGFTGFRPLHLNRQ